MDAVNIRILVLALSTLNWISACAPPQSSPMPPPEIPLPATRIYDASAIDRSVDACTDFYQYACGGWEKRHPRPSDSGSYYRSWTQYAREADDYVRQLIETADESAGADAGNVSTLFEACMDESAIESLGIAPLAPLFSEIDRVETASELSVMLGNVSSRLKYDYRTKPPLLSISAWADPSEGGSTFRLYVRGSVIGFPATDYYLDESENGTALRAAYLAYLNGALADIGYDEITSRSHANKILALETAISSAGLSAAEVRNEAIDASGLASLQTLGERYPNVDWPGLLGALGAAPLPDAVVVADGAQLAAANAWITDENIDALKAYLKLALVVDHVDLMPVGLRNRHFQFFGQTLNGQTDPAPRWRTCVGLTKIVMPEAVSRMFIEATGIESSKAASLDVFAAIRDEMRLRLETADWIDDDTRAGALAKLGDLRASFVAPDNWLDDRTRNAKSGAAAETTMDFSMARRAREMGSLGAPMNINEWFDAPIYVSAFQVNEMNAIYVTAAQMLMLDIGSGDLAVEYGGLGVFLGHELSHGYDRLGSQYDGIGRTRNWWSAEDAQTFDRRNQCILDEASTYAYPSGDPVNGAFVVSEQAAEMTGLDIAYAAYQRAKSGTTLPDRDGLTADQRFFTAAAQTFCMQASEESWGLIATSDSHMWGPPGINMVMRNSPAFAKAFSCEPDAPMVKPEAEVCRTW